jgi:hypothetical protein
VLSSPGGPASPAFPGSPGCPGGPGGPKNLIFTHPFIFISLLTAVFWQKLAETRNFKNESLH